MLLFPGASDYDLFTNLINYDARMMGRFLAQQLLILFFSASLAVGVSGEIDQEFLETLKEIGAERLKAEENFALALKYYHGDGVPQDYVEAAKFFHLSAEDGHSGAQVRLGYQYLVGEGVPQNYVEAAKFFHLSAEQGVVIAQHLLGGLYLTGYGVPQNITYAYVWLSLAAAKGLEEAKDYRDLAAAGLNPEQIAQAQEIAARCLKHRYRDCDINPVKWRTDPLPPLKSLKRLD